ncbi:MULTISPECIES: alpha/beta hydrolase [unclassified Enterococcus]|uniref:alpha/beta hydrolase n=1 Tax=unclassified Enterococcus TaxID=2608891 RepID=UPI0015580178|nr:MULTISPECIES: alpha/beta hydrolase [unclassified Enterococcus]MBS7576508.1 alpha/beta hydrolase [Enterococcus sp. MMGLQ5-2]MBS7585599.1 alpha/beta hydrolase [Enterococcus sp. MMGLQ5-1]NPD13458.1 alpha/beta hydrolase [Enterococcus sp. MMGLQ5-1]NPD36345.1 alpha/beta hydrolase [Enterococcus sp. MMGLQ5-2]
MRVNRIELKTPYSSNAYLTSYLIDYGLDMKMRPAIILCPGGGYKRISKREGEPVALQFLAKGYQVFVLNYNVCPHKFPTALFELASAIKLIRENASDYDINPEQIIIGGFSAGGHLAGYLAATWQNEQQWAPFYKLDDIKPNALFLCYPVITTETAFRHEASFLRLLGNGANSNIEMFSIEKLVTKCMPKTFIWHTFEDQLVSVQNSLLLGQALAQLKIPFELHIFTEGDHGLSLATKETLRVSDSKSPIQAAKWFELLNQWLHDIILS